MQDAAAQSEEHIDKKVFAISAGAIGLELTLLKLFDGKSLNWYWLAILAAGSFVMALLLNLVVHLVGKRFQSKQSKMIKDFIYEAPQASQSHQIYETIEKHGVTIFWINLFSSILAITGVICLFVFTFLNLNLS